jgi:hypothetical protein
VDPSLACNGFNPEGASLGTLTRCATNSYDNNGYLTLDFTCSASPCSVDGDCPLVTNTCPLALSSRCLPKSSRMAPRMVASLAFAVSFLS